MSRVYFLDKENLKVKNILDSTSYSIEKTSESAGKSNVELHKKPFDNDNEECIVFIRDKKEELFVLGTIDKTDTNAESCKVSLKEINTIFDRKIILSNENIKADTGIEDFIANQITSNFILNPDASLNYSYLEVNVLTHTVVHAAVESDKGIYNLMTYIDNARENYGIFLDFKCVKDKLVIDISNKSKEKELSINTSYDIASCEEVYSTTVLATLQVLWAKSEDDTNPTIKNYYLLNDRTIGTDMDDVNRAKGTIDTVRIVAETEEALWEEVQKSFTANSYEHSITAKVKISSSIYETTAFYIGKKCKVKTSKGIRESMITNISYNDKSKYMTVKFGKMPITFIEKLRKERKE